jgi:hypothetical protein
LHELRKMRFLREPKVSRLVVSITALDAKPTIHVPAAMQESLDTQSDLFSMATTEVNSAQFELGQAQMQGAGAEADARVAAATAKVLEAEQRAEDRDLALMDFHSRKMDEAGSTGFDAVQASFLLAAPAPLAEAYAILLFEMELPGEPGIPRQTVRMYRVTDIGEKPKKVRAFAKGFPKGFRLTSCKVHVYAGAEELATNVSDNRTSVTRDEAHQFLVMQHQLAQRGATLAPAPLRTLAEPGGHGALSAGELAREVTLVISAAGLPVRCFAGNDRSRELEDPLRSVVLAARFLPALRAGQPEESTWTGALDEIL